MQNSRTKNSVLIMVTSGLRQALTVLLTFVSRTVFIKVLGADYLGLNGLFSNILSLLALSELGIATAISFYLYKPLVDNDNVRIKTLMHFYKLCYRLVGLAIIGIGVCIMPMLPHIVNFGQGVPVNLYVVYFIYILNTACSYLFFAYKQVLVTANQEQYKIEKMNIVFSFINCLADIFVLVIARNYIVYLLVKLMLLLISNLCIAIKIDNEYPFLKEKEAIPLSKDEKKAFFRDIGSVALFKVGSTLFNTTDNIIISILLGTVIVGYYSNYYMILSQIMIIIGLIVRSFTAGIGNIIAKETSDKQFATFKQIHFVIYLVASVCTACLFQLLNSFIRLWVGGIDQNYVLSQLVVAILCINFYFDSTTQIMNSFREASGHFSAGKHLQLTGGIVNIMLSVLLGKYFGLVGVFAATVISKGLVTIIPFIVLISKVIFEKGSFTILIEYFRNSAVTILAIAILWLVCLKIHMTTVIGFVFECILSVTIPSLILILIFSKTSEMRGLVQRVKRMVQGFKQ